jgi:uracil-DNA glycosylase
VATPHAEAGFATVHPSAVLRAPADLRAGAERQFVNDLRKVARWMAAHGG